jgi:hypothetical protein
VCEIFVLLACCTAFDVFHDLSPSAGPEVFPIFFFYASDSFVSSRVAVGSPFVPYCYDLP